VLASKELRDVLVQEPAISATLAEQSDLDIALVGIGQSSRAAIDCAGELVLHSYDDRGALLVNDGDERSIGISIDALRRTPTVLAIACGVEKTRAIAGALRTGIVNMLVIDAATAEAVLAFEPSDPETLK
jgi:DNA-binding transcriptional regulator LsrR (DeoR family)